MLKHLVMFLLCYSSLWSMPIYSFTTGYSGVPIFREDFAPIHEMVTAEGLRKLCERRGVDALNENSFQKSFLNYELSSCDQLLFGDKQRDWVDQIKDYPFRGFVLGSRYPDLLEMAGIDANKVDITILKHNSDVQIDSYRLYPHWHGQLSKYHNVFDGDQYLAMRVIIEALENGIREAIQFKSDSSEKKIDTLMAAHSMLRHDINLSQKNLFYEVNWQQVELGKVFHMIGDIFAKTPLIVVEADRLIHTALPYSKFRDDSGLIVDADQLFNRLDIRRGDKVEPAYEHFLERKSFDFAKIPSGEPNFEYLLYSLRGDAYPSRYLLTTLASAAIEELVELILDTDPSIEDRSVIDLRIGKYLARWFSYDFHYHSGFEPINVNNKMTANQKSLPWYSYHQVDLWEETGLTKNGDVQGYILPFTKRDSMDDISDSVKMPIRTIIGQVGDGEEDRSQRIT